MKNNRTSRAIDDIKIRDIKDFRKTYENAVSYKYGEIPMEISERNANKLLVNCLRHEHSNYDKIRHTNFNKQYPYCKNAVLEQIAIKYPSLENECNRQKRNIIFVRKVV